jgi:cytochrome c biogenesis protein CcmG, thiol:disulfide interchange protein DsbE
MGIAAGLAAIVPEILSGCAKEAPAVGSMLSEIALGDLTGKRVVIPRDLTGKIAVLHFWAGWCPACRGEMTALDAIGNKYRQENVVPYSIGVGETRITAVRYIKNLGITYPVLLDPDSVTQRQFGIAGIPTYYVLNREGIIRFKILGEADKNGWDKIIRTLI